MTPMLNGLKNQTKPKKMSKTNFLTNKVNF